MPQTTEVFWSWTSTVPPAARISPAPLRPSDPMPVRTTARTAPSKAVTAERKSGSTAGRQKFSGGPWLSPVVRPGRPLRGPADRTTRWWSPGARWTVPGASGVPSEASTTRSGHSRSRRWANCRVNTGGMCCTSSTGTGREAGSCGSTPASASGPPVEEPITRTAGFLPGPVRRAAGGGGGAAVGAGAGARSRRRRGRGGGADRADRDRAPGERLDLRDQLLADALHRLADAADVGRLGDVVVRPGGQRVQGRRGAPLGQRAEHDDRHPAACRADGTNRLD